MAPNNPGRRAPVEDAAAIEADVNDDASVSGSVAVSEGTSVAASIYHYRLENGRTYHAYKDGAYLIPNDEKENERLDLQHHLSIASQGGTLFCCPAGKDKPLTRVLDAGTGTGIWAMDLADEFPDATITGVDLSPIQPKFVPPNVNFFVDDLEADWNFSQPFDFIYCRMLTMSIYDFPKLFRQAYDNLVPGGWLEMFDVVWPMNCDDGTMPPGHTLRRWTQLVRDASDKLYKGGGLDSALKYKQQVLDAGFVNVEERNIKWPSNTWPRDPGLKEQGAWSLENALNGCEGWSMAMLTRVEGWKPEDVHALLVEVKAELRNRNVHAYWPIRVVYGQKPE